MAPAPAPTTADCTVHHPHADAIDAARWMHTGDIGVRDGDGYIE